MTERELEEIRARERAAAPGPWRVSRVSNLHSSPVGDGRSHPALRGLRAPKRLYERAWQQVEADMEFMAAAREDVPRLVAEVDRLRAKFLEVRHRLLQLANDFPSEPSTNGVLSIAAAMDSEEKRWLRFQGQQRATVVRLVNQPAAVKASR
jgi:hypothetical protein